MHIFAGMGITIGAVWFTLCSAVIFRYKKFNTFGIRKPVVAGILVLKVLTGIIYTYIHLHYYGGGDTVMTFYKSEIIYRTLFSNPGIFLKLMVLHPVPIPPELVDYANRLDFYTDSSTYFIIRLQTLFRLVSGGHLLPHIVIFNFLMLWGTLCFYGFCKTILGTRSWFVLLVLFLMPSATFWTSGIHKDGIELCGIALILCSAQQFISRSLNISGILRFLLGAFLLYEARVYVLLILTVCLLAWIIAQSFRSRQGSIFILVLSLLVGLFLCSAFLGKGFNLLYIMYYWQGMFMYINHGNSNLLLPVLQPSIDGLLKVMPVAFENVFLHPNVLELLNVFLTADFFINLLHGILLALGICCFIVIPKSNPIVLATLLLVSMGLLTSLFYGMIVGNLGALSRYRSVPMLILWMGYSLPISQWLSAKKMTQTINNILFLK